jgi:hypothetical protein
VSENVKRSEGTHVNAVRRWWRQGDQFDWLTLYLNTRGIRLIWRAVIAVVIASMAVVPVVLLAGPTLPRYPVAEIVAPVASGVGMTVALLWLIRWPTRGQSVVFALTGSVCITASCLVQRDPLAALLGCFAFAVLGGYIAFFHTAQYMVTNFAIAIATAVAIASRLIRSYDIFVAGCGLMLVLVLNVAFPIAVQWLVHALASELRQSSRDALTGLLIRRAFYQSTYGLLLRRREGPNYLVAAMIASSASTILKAMSLATRPWSRWPVLSVWPARPHQLSRALAAKIRRRHLPHRRLTWHRRTFAQCHRRYPLPHYGQHRHRQHPAGPELRSC